MSNYWQVSIKINQEVNEQATNNNIALNSPFGDYDDTAQPFGEVEDVKDVISQLLFEFFPCEGVVLEEETFIELKRTGRADCIRAFLSNYVSPKEIKNLLVENIIDDLDLDVSIVQIEDKDWSEEWKKGWMPTKISDRIVIRPTWRKYVPNENEIVVDLDPGMAFGTGTHATTQLCVCAMEKYMKEHSILADVGCGSGILAICGVKLGAKSAVAVDNDETVIPVAIDNAKLNSVDDIEFFVGSSKDMLGKTYDFVCANILHNVLDVIMCELKQLLNPDGKMVLSGILDEKEHIVQNAIQRENLKVVDRLVQGHWVAIVVSL